MKKHRVAVVMGGFSGESEVSLQSGKMVLSSLNPTEYEAYPVYISAQHWYCEYQGSRYPIDKNDFSIGGLPTPLGFDVVFNAIHGSPGEDGMLAGYLDMLGIPYTSCGIFESALTFNKVECTSLCRELGVTAPLQKVLINRQPWEIAEITEVIGLPCFVKPSRSGSSIGVSKVTAAAHLAKAIEAAFAIDDKVIVEELISGREVGCGVSNHNGSPQALAITDIVPKNDFFDYESKYSGLSEEITPARISQKVYRQIMEESEHLYESLRLKGLVRIDYIVSADDVPFFIEINSIPGISAESIVPKQLDYLHLTKQEVFGKMLWQALQNKPL